MKTLIAIVALMALPVPAVAAECSSGTVRWMGTSPLIDEMLSDGPPMSIDGRYFQIHSDVEATVAVNGTVIARAPAGEWVSVGVPSDAETFDICPGSADVPAAAGQESEPIGDTDVEREVEPWQEIADVAVETWRDWMSGGAYPI